MTVIIRKKLWVQSVVLSGVQTASTNGAADTGYAGVDNAIFQLATTVVTGTTPSMVVKVQDSIDGINWNDLTTFTAAIGVTAEVKRVAGPFGDWVRAISTITGTTPSFTYSVKAQVEAKATN